MTAGSVKSQDVHIPPDLLATTTSTSTTTIKADSDYDDEVTQSPPPTEYLIESTTIRSDSTTKNCDDDGNIIEGSCIENPIIKLPMSENLLDATNPMYTYPQIISSYPINPPSSNNNNNNNPSNCNNNINYPPQMPVLVPPVWSEVTIEPDFEELNQCPIGFVQKNNKTECVPLYENCSSGYVWKNERCVLSQTYCPLNFDFNGTSCVEKKVCPSNHVWVDGKCEPDLSCPEEYHWDAEKSSCVLIKIQCQQGSVLIDNECVFESFTCPLGFDLVNEQCIKPTPVCQHGFELQLSGFCSQKNIKCSVGSVLVNGNCQRFEMTCPEGTQRIGDQCFQINIITTTTSTPYPPSTSTTTASSTSTSKPITTTAQNPSSTYSSPPDDLNTQFPPSSTDKTMPETSQKPPIQKVCPDDFSFFNGKCYKCAEDYALCNGLCLKKTVQCNRYFSRHYPRPYPHHNYPPAPNINININLSNPYIPISSSPSLNERPTIINKIEPINNTIYNINNITHPVMLNNVNEVNNNYLLVQYILIRFIN